MPSLASQDRDFLCSPGGSWRVHDQPLPSATREHGPGAKRVLPLLFTCSDAAGVGLIVPLLPTLIGSVAPLAIRDAATWGAALVMTFALLYCSSPVLGSLSDRFGRRPVLVLAMLGFALSYLLLALADSLWTLFLGRALAGLTGASVATAMPARLTSARTAAHPAPRLAVRRPSPWA
ncbi:MFS transporter [Pseudomonas aeruginosa]